MRFILLSFLPRLPLLNKQQLTQNDCRDLTNVKAGSSARRRRQVWAQGGNSRASMPCVAGICDIDMETWVHSFGLHASGSSRYHICCVLCRRTHEATEYKGEVIWAGGEGSACMGMLKLS